MLNVRSSVNIALQLYTALHGMASYIHSFIILLAILLANNAYNHMVFYSFIYMLAVVNMLALLTASNNFDNYLAIMIIIVIALHA